MADTWSHSGIAENSVGLTHLAQALSTLHVKTEGQGACHFHCVLWDRPNHFLISLALGLMDFNQVDTRSISQIDDATASFVDANTI